MKNIAKELIENIDVSSLKNTLKKINIGIIDSGVDFTHPEIKKSKLINKDIVNKTVDSKDNLGHGTMVAGIIIEIAPYVTISSYNVFFKGISKSKWVIEAINEAINDGMNIINISLGTLKSIDVEEDRCIIKKYIKVINRANDKNCIIVTASGTSSEYCGKEIYKLKNLKEYNCHDIFIPPALENIITVGSCDNKNKLAKYSNYGECVDILAVCGGSYIEDMECVKYPLNLEQSKISKQLNLKKGQEIIAGSTSLAAPKITGALSLILAKYILVHNEIPKKNLLKYLLFKGCIPISDSRKLINCKGILNIKNSMNLIKELKQNDRSKKNN